MTVCIAVLFKWNYSAKEGQPDWRTAALTASDRMLTAGDVQYEPNQQKMAEFGKSIVLVAGDMQLHMEAIALTTKEIGSRELPPQNVAQIYGRAIQAINRRRAENEILAPLGLNLDTFAAQLKDYPDGFINMIVGQLQNRRPIDAEALVVGTDGQDTHLYLVDEHGNDFNLDGVGFGAIGIGAWHAKSRLMQISYNSRNVFAWAQASIYAAKKIAELAPGVGKYTDLHLVHRMGHELVLPLAIRKLEELYGKYTGKTDELARQMIEELQNFMDDPRNWREVVNDERQSEQRSQAGVGASAATPEAARGNEAGSESPPRSKS